MNHLTSVAIAVLVPLVAASGDYSAVLKLRVAKQGWDSAADACAEEGGVLAFIASEDEHTFVVDLAIAADVSEYWIGGVRIGTGGTDSDWQWVTGSSVTVPVFGVGLPDRDSDGNTDLWDRGEPNNFRNRENCIRGGGTSKTQLNGRWNDAICNKKYSYLCRFERKCALRVVSSFVAPGRLVLKVGCW